jgi:hypothetical protein
MPRSQTILNVDMRSGPSAFSCPPSARWYLAFASVRMPRLRTALNVDVCSGSSALSYLAGARWYIDSALTSLPGPDRKCPGCGPFSTSTCALGPALSRAPQCSLVFGLFHPAIGAADHPLTRNPYEQERKHDVSTYEEP